MPALHASLLLLAVAAGAGLAFQAVINTRLSAALGSPLWAAVVQVFAGLVFLLACVLILRQPPPSLAGASRLPWWIWTGGAIGAAYVLTVIVTTRPLGVKTNLPSAFSTLDAKTMFPLTSAARGTPGPRTWRPD